MTYRTNIAINPPIIPPKKPKMPPFTSVAVVLFSIFPIFLTILY